MLTRRGMLGATAGAGVAVTVGANGQAQTPAAKRLIVDSQVHLWKADTPDRPWSPGSRAQLPEPMTIERVVPLMDAGGVDRIVIVPPSLEGERVDYGQEAARRYPGRFATMGRIALDDPRGAARLPGWLKQPAVVGIRFNITNDQAVWLTNGTADWFWPAAEKARIPIMFLSNGLTARFGEIAERFPQLPLIVDHMGVVPEQVKKGEMGEAVRVTASLAKYPNVSVKLSSSPLYSAEAYPFRDLRPHIQRLVEAYGPRRCHWGSDLTNTFALGSYRQRVTHFTEELPFLSEEDKDWIMGRSLLERLNWA